MSLSFSASAARKTPFQKHKKALNARKKKEQEETAAVYADFVESFAEQPNAVCGWPLRRPA